MDGNGTIKIQKLRRNFKTFKILDAIFIEKTIVMIIKFEIGYIIKLLQELLNFSLNSKWM